VSYRQEKIFIGFDNGKFGKWNMLTPIDSNIHEEKEVIFRYEYILVKS